MSPHQLFLFSALLCCLILANCELTAQDIDHLKVQAVKNLEQYQKSLTQCKAKKAKTSEETLILNGDMQMLNNLDSDLLASLKLIEDEWTEREKSTAELSTISQRIEQISQDNQWKVDFESLVNQISQMDLTTDKDQKVAEDLIAHFFEQYFNCDWSELNLIFFVDLFFEKMPSAEQLEAINRIVVGTIFEQKDMKQWIKNGLDQFFPGGMDPEDLGKAVVGMLERMFSFLPDREMSKMIIINSINTYSSKELGFDVAHVSLKNMVRIYFVVIERFRKTSTQFDSAPYFNELSSYLAKHNLRFQTEVSHLKASLERKSADQADMDKRISQYIASLYEKMEQDMETAKAVYKQDEAVNTKNEL